MSTSWRTALLVLGAATFALSAADGRGPSADAEMVARPVAPVTVMPLPGMATTIRPTQASVPSLAAAPGVRATQRSSKPAAVRPFVQSFAQQPEGRPRPPAPRPKAPPSVPVSIDGCDHDYEMPGKPNLCVPWQFPRDVTDRCDWLRDHGYFDPIAGRSAVQLLVRGVDRHGLDSDHDGEACDVARQPGVTG